MVNRDLKYDSYNRIDPAFIEKAKELATTKRNRRNKRRLFLLGRGGFYVHKIVA